MHGHIYKNMDQITIEKHLIGTPNFCFLFGSFCFLFFVSFVFVVHFLVCFFIIGFVILFFLLISLSFFFLSLFFQDLIFILWNCSEVEQYSSDSDYNDIATFLYSSKRAPRNTELTPPPKFSVFFPKSLSQSCLPYSFTNTPSLCTAHSCNSSHLCMYVGCLGKAQSNSGGTPGWGLQEA